MVRRPGRLLAIAAVLGVAANVLFWGAAPGWSFPLAAVLLIAAMGAVALQEGARPHPRTLALTLPVVLLATGTVLRADPLTVALDALLTVGVIGVAALTWSTGDWQVAGVRAWLGRTRRLSGDLATGGARVAAAVAAEHPVAGRGELRRALPVVRGLALALPLVGVLGLLLVSADAVFAAQVDRVLTDLPRPDLTEAVGRTAFGLVVAVGAAGFLAHLLRAPVPLVTGPSTPDSRGGSGVTLGATETGIVLGLVDLLFAAFVAVQVRYLFAAPTAALPGGLSHAEYARRGFVELVVVAVLSLALVAAVGAWTRRETRVERQVVAILSSGLVGLVVVILASAFQRLLLYADAFGYTRSRTYGQVGMAWLGILLLWTLWLAVRGRVRVRPGALVAVGVGLALTLTAVDVDGFVARRNVERAVRGAELDTAYLARLSGDAVPVLAALAPGLPSPVSAQVAEILACQRDRLRLDEPRPWQSRTVSGTRARAALADVDLPACSGAADAR